MKIFGRFILLSILSTLVVSAGAVDAATSAVSESAVDMPVYAEAPLDPELDAGTTTVAAAPNAIASNNRIEVNGTEVYPEAYKINGNNYYKLRDVAYLMVGKTAAFNVIWDGTEGVINLLPGVQYETVGGELKKASANKTLRVSAATAAVTLSGKAVSMEGYCINGNNYYKLRDMGELLLFEVSYNADSATVEINTNELPVDPSVTPVDPPVAPPVVTEPVRTSQIDGVMTVIIDAGHGGDDAGAINEDRDLDEKHVNLYVAQRLKNLLEQNGVTVHMVRDSLDEGSSLYLRGEVMDEYINTVDLFFGLHHNASNGSARGAQVLAQVADENGGPSKTLATLLNKEYEKNGLTIRPIWFREGDHGDYYYTNRYAASLDITAVISEYCFIDNEDDVKFIDSSEDWDAEAEAQCMAILNYFAQTEY